MSRFKYLGQHGNHATFSSAANIDRSQTGRPMKSQTQCQYYLYIHRYLETCEVDRAISMELYTEGVNIENHKTAAFRDALAAAAIRCTNFQRYETCPGGAGLRVCGSRIVQSIESLALLAHHQGCCYVLPGSLLSALSESCVRWQRSETASCSNAWIKWRIFVREPLGV